MRVVVAAREVVSGRDASLAVVIPAEARLVRRVADLLGVSQIAPVHDSRDAALAKERLA